MIGSMDHMIRSVDHMIDWMDHMIGSVDLKGCVISIKILQCFAAPQ